MHSDRKKHRPFLVSFCWWCEPLVFKRTLVFYGSDNNCNGGPLGKSRKWCPPWYCRGFHRDFCLFGAKCLAKGIERKIWIQTRQESIESRMLGTLVGWRWRKEAQHFEVRFIGILYVIPYSDTRLVHAKFHNWCYQQIVFRSYHQPMMIMNKQPAGDWLSHSFR